MTNHDIAKVINETKPNLKSFWASLNDPNALFHTLINEPFSYLNAFKLELLVVLMITHKKYYLWNSEKTLYCDYLTAHNIDQTTLIPNSGRAP